MVKQIVERIRNKDQRAMSELYQMYIGELSSVCYQKKLLFVEQDEIKQKQADIADDTPATEQISADQLHQLISELPDGYRTVLNLYVFEDYSHRQIAELLGIKEGTSASQLYYAKQWLARRIKELIIEKG